MTEKPKPIKPEPVKPKPINPKNIPTVRREMRGVWIATVDNIDWPSKPGLPVARQKAELRSMLDTLQALNMNTVFLQVRPAADALYKSSIEPWSYYLTGEQGRPPRPFYDPLKFAVKEAHRRGLELHAWFNPFRAYHPSEPQHFSPKSIQKSHPGWVVDYGKYQWINPGIKSARDYSMKVILDVARRYDIDGVHMDDYFYPYPEKNGHGHKIPFPDDGAYKAYLENHNYINRGDWRRQNINRFIKHLRDSLKKVKPQIQFGISPFGIWRPGHPPQIKGYDAYNKIYADSRKWLRKGWVDYLAPQLYWPIDQPGQSFPVLLKWWEKQNYFNRHLWPGLYTNRAGKSWDASEVTHQIQIIRNQEPNASGAIHFSMKALMNETSQINNRLKWITYKQPALIPSSPWLPDQLPQQPCASLHKNGNQLVIHLMSSCHTKQPYLWVVKLKYGRQWTIAILPGLKQEHSIAVSNENGQFQGAVISKVNRIGKKSAGQILLPVME